MSTIDKIIYGSQTLEVVDVEARSQIAGKADKEEGKTLSTNDLTNELKTNYDAAYAHISDTNNPHNITPESIGAAKASDIPSITGLATESFVNEKVAEIVNSAPETLDTLQELATALGNDADFATTMTNSLANKADKDHTHAQYLTEHQDLSSKVDKVEGKGLSTNDLTADLKTNYDAAYTHSQATHAPVNAQKNSDITKAEIEAKLTGDVTTHTHAQYLTEHQDLSEYAKTADLPSVEGFAPKDSPVFTNNISMGRRENSTTGSYSVAVGAELQASGMFSHAEGYWAIASNDASHAEGYGTTASGSSSHAEGTNSVASGSSSHAEGSHTQASGGCSHTEGIYTIASSDYQHVEGKYNVEDTINKYAHIVGNGSDENARSNAHTLDWNGNAWYAGNVSINGNPTKNNNLVTKEYADNKLLNITTYLDEDITDSTSTITYKDNYSAYTFDKIDIASVINNLKLEVKVENNLSSNIVDSVIIFKDFVYDSTLEAYSAYFSTEENTDQEDKVYITNDDTKTIIVYSTEFTFYGLWKHIKLYKTEDKYANKTDIHTHSNKEVLDGITVEKVAQWDSNTGSGGGTTSGINIVTISQSDYDALETKDPNTLYLITTTNAGEIDTASNDITLSDDLPAGTYTLKYEDENNQPLEGFDEITTMEVQ